MIFFLEKGEAGVGTWRETGCFQTQPMEGKVASHLGQPLTGRRKAGWGWKCICSQQLGRGRNESRRPDRDYGDGSKCVSRTQTPFRSHPCHPEGVHTVLAGLSICF